MPVEAGADAIAGAQAYEDLHVPDALRAPFVLGDSEALGSVFEGAGVDEVQVETRTGTARFPSVRTMVEADLRGWLPLMGVHLTEAVIEEVLQASEAAMSD